MIKQQTKEKLDQMLNTAKVDRTTWDHLANKYKVPEDVRQQVNSCIQQYENIINSINSEV